MHGITSVIWGILIGIGWAAASCCLERLFFHLSRREADPLILEKELQRWKSAGRLLTLAPTARLGWLNRLLDQAGYQTERLLQLTLGEQKQMLRFRDFLPMCGNVATATGLLASVVALHQTAHTTDTRSVIALGMEATIIGLVIAIPVTILGGVFTARTDRLTEQADQVIGTLERLIYPDENGTPAPRPKELPEPTPAVREALPASKPARRPPARARTAPVQTPAPPALEFNGWGPEDGYAD